MPPPPSPTTHTHTHYSRNRNNNTLTHDKRRAKWRNPIHFGADNCTCPVFFPHKHVSNSIFTIFALTQKAIRSKHALKIKAPESDWTSGSHSCIRRQMYALNYGDIGTNAVPGDTASWVQRECFRGQQCCSATVHSHWNAFPFLPNSSNDTHMPLITTQDFVATVLARCLPQQVTSRFNCYGLLTLSHSVYSSLHFEEL